MFSMCTSKKRKKKSIPPAYFYVKYSIRIRTAQPVLLINPLFFLLLLLLEELMAPSSCLFWCVINSFSSKIFCNHLIKVPAQLEWFAAGRLFSSAFKKENVLYFQCQFMYLAKCILAYCWFLQSCKTTGNSKGFKCTLVQVSKCQLFCHSTKSLPKLYKAFLFCSLSHSLNRILTCK